MSVTSPIDIQIKLLVDHSYYLPELAQLWHKELIGRWVPGITVEQAQTRLSTHLNKDCLPFTLIALDQDKPIGMASLRAQEENVGSELSPWLGGLVVNPNYRKQGIGETLIEAIKQKAREFNYAELFLLTFDPTLPGWYSRLGWEEIGTDKLHERPITLMKFQF